MLVQLTVTAANVDTLISLGYSCIEVWASIDQGNSYQEVTSSVAQSAVLTSSAAQTTFQMGGKLLKLSIDGAAEESVLFSTTPSNWTPLQVVNRINEVVSGLASLDGLSVVLTSPTTGRVSSLLVVYNDAEDLELPAGTVAYGTEARPVFVSGQFIYVFHDVAGTSDTRYKWRYSADGVNPISEYSVRIFGSAPPLVGVPVSIGVAQFVGSDGRAQKRRVVVVSDRTPSVIAGSAVGDEVPGIFDSDDLGFLQLTLVQGAKVRVAIEGTVYVREFIVPSTEVFDLLAVMATAPDPFTVQTTPPLLIRRSI